MSKVASDHQGEFVVNQLELLSGNWPASNNARRSAQYTWLNKALRRNWPQDQAETIDQMNLLRIRANTKRVLTADDFRWQDGQPQLQWTVEQLLDSPEFELDRSLSAEITRQIHPASGPGMRKQAAQFYCKGYVHDRLARQWAEELPIKELPFGPGRLKLKRPLARKEAKELCREIFSDSPSADVRRLGLGLKAEWLIKDLTPEEAADPRPYAALRILTENPLRARPFIRHLTLKYATSGQLSQAFIELCESQAAADQDLVREIESELERRVLRAPDRKREKVQTRGSRLATALWLASLEGSWSAADWIIQRCSWAEQSPKYPVTSNLIGNARMLEVARGTGRQDEVSKMVERSLVHINAAGLKRTERAIKQLQGVRRSRLGWLEKEDRKAQIK